MVASLCLQWNYTQHLVDYSNICQISMLFISFFCQKMSCVCQKSETLCSVGVSAQIGPHCPENPSPDVKTLHFRSARMTGKTYGFPYQHVRFPVETVSADAHQTLTLHPCWDVAAWVCPEGVESPPHPEVLSLLPSKYGEWRVMAIWTEHSAPLRMGHKWLPVAVSHKFEGSLQPCQIQMFSFALLVIKWLAIFLIGNTNCHSLHSF